MKVLVRKGKSATAATKRLEVFSPSLQTCEKVYLLTRTILVSLLQFLKFDTDWDKSMQTEIVPGSEHQRHSTYGTESILLPWSSLIS
jgi:hypothetical protein